MLGAEVVSSSLGYTDWYTFENMNGEIALSTIAADHAVSLGIVVVNAAGNERNNPWGHIIAPADGFDVIAVGAVDASGAIASFSSPGPTYDGRIKPEVCALGVDNWLAANRSDGSDIYRTDSGTSFATPLVAGVSALLPNTSQSSENPFVIKIPASFIGDHVVFRLRVKGPNSITLYESLRVSISR